MRFKNIEIPRFCGFLTNIFPFNNNRMHFLPLFRRKDGNLCPWTRTELMSFSHLSPVSPVFSQSGTQKVQLDQRSIIYAHPSANSICRCDFSVRIRHPHRMENPRRKAEQKRSCCICQRSYYQKKRADNPYSSIGYGLSALRLCVRLFDNCYFERKACVCFFQLLHHASGFSGP